MIGFAPSSDASSNCNDYYDTVSCIRQESASTIVIARRFTTFAWITLVTNTRFHTWRQTNERFEASVVRACLQHATLKLCSSVFSQFANPSKVTVLNMRHTRVGSSDWMNPMTALWHDTEKLFRSSGEISCEVSIVIKVMVWYCCHRVSKENTKRIKVLSVQTYELPRNAWCI